MAVARRRHKHVLWQKQKLALKRASRATDRDVVILPWPASLLITLPRLRDDGGLLAAAQLGHAALGHGLLDQRGQRNLNTETRGEHEQNTRVSAISGKANKIEVQCDMCCECVRVCSDRRRLLQLCRVRLVLLDVHAHRCADAARATQSEDDARAVAHQEADALVRRNALVHGIGVGELVGVRHGERTPLAAHGGRSQLHKV